VIEQSKKDALTQILRLPATLDLRAAGPLVANFNAARGNHVAIDASQVDKIGTQCVQVLMSAHVTWARDGIPLVMTNPSQALLDTLDVLGIPLNKIAEQENSK
jgi:chemotaxis protein CheX